MIFASDLDRTLIYSKRFLNDTVSYQVVERKGEEDIAHMTIQAIELLETISNENLSIPVTTRTEAEYKRISLMTDLSPEYAIVSNGGKILIDGVEDLKWKEHVESTLSNMSHTLDQIRDAFFNHTDVEKFNLEKKSDNMFWMFRLNDETEGEKILSILKPIMKEYGWDLTQTGRKMYLVPEELTKWKALSFLAQSLGEEIIIAAGDSLMDLEMVSNATVGITPAHGEIVETSQSTDKMVVTQSSGLLAGQEILEEVQKIRTELMTLI